MKSTKEILTKQDSLVLRSTPSKPYTKLVVIRLQGKERIIGNLDLAGDGTFQTTRKGKHLFKKTNSFGLPYALLSNEKVRFKWIVIDYKGRKLVTSRQYFLHHGNVRQYKDFELQVMLLLDKFGINEARKFEKNGPCPEQQSLFGEAA